MIKKNCIACRKEVSALWEDNESNLLDAFWVTDSGSYGSDYDMTTIKFILCDECITQALRDSVAEAGRLVITKKTEWVAVMEEQIWGDLEEETPTTER